MSGAAQPIGPGSMVVCISTEQNSLLPHSSFRLTKDALYCVEAILPWATGCCIDTCERGLILKGRTDPVYFGLRSAYVGYCPSQFKPLNDGDTSLVENEKTDDTDCDGSGLQTYRRILEPTT